MYRDIYDFHVMDEIKKGMLVCCTDRQKGENFYCNGMTVSDLIELLVQAEADKTNRFQFYTYVEQKEVTDNDA